MAKKKPAKNNAVKNKASSGKNKTVMSFMALPVIVILAAIGLFAYFLINIQLEPINERHRSALISGITDQYEAYINNVLDQQNAAVQQIATSENVINLVNEGDSEQLRKAEQAIASQVQNGLTVHIFPIRQARQDSTSNPPLSFAGLDMINRAEQGQNTYIEAHQHDGTAYLQSVKAVRNGSGRLIGTVSVAQSLAFLSNQLAGIDSTKGNLLIQQQFEGAQKQTLVTYGAKNSNSVLSLKLNNPYWTLTFQPADELVYATILSTSSLWIFFAGLALICILPIGLAAQRLQSSIRVDANTFAKQVQAILSGQKVPSAEYRFAIFSTLAKTINRMRMGRQGVKSSDPAEQTSILDFALAKPVNAEEVENFDIPMMDSDNDLLGMQQSNKKTSHVNVDESIFRAYDIRGIVGQNLTAVVAEQIGLSIGSEAHDRGEQTVIVGRDGRLSSPEMAESLIRGLTASGRDVIDIGVVPTPVAYFACEQLRAASCVMVTGSHNPAAYNGFKIVIGGNTLADDEIKGLYHRIENQNFLSGTGKTTTKDISGAYLTRICEDVKTKRALKVVIDCGNGVAGNIAPQLIKGIGCHVLPLFCDVDGNFPNHHPDPSDPKNLQDLARTVVETRADLGIAFDGDGDRIGIITNSGKVVYSDRLLMLLAKQVLQVNQGATVLFDVKSSRRLKNIIIGFGGRPIMWKTGHSYIKRKMKETGAALAGEMSGHIFYKDRWYGFDDALYTATRLLEIIASQNETIDTLLNELPQDVATPELSIMSTDEDKFKIVEALQRNGQFSGGQMTDIDGIRVDFQSGWGLVRASNTAPKLVCRFEAETAEALGKIQAVFKQQLLKIDGELNLPF